MRHYCCNRFKSFVFSIWLWLYHCKTSLGKIGVGIYVDGPWRTASLVKPFDTYTVSEGEDLRNHLIEDLNTIAQLAPINTYYLLLNELLTSYFGVQCSRKVSYLNEKLYDKRSYVDLWRTKTVKRFHKRSSDVSCRQQIKKNILLSGLKQ